MNAIGACFGTCAAGCCCSLAQTGSLDTMKGARCLLLWLQISFLAFAIPLMGAQHTWVDSACDWANFAGQGSIGICECGLLGNPIVTLCRQDQLVLRATASVEAIFLFQLLLALSGCASKAAFGLPVAKFMALPVLWAIFLLVPNQIFDTLGMVSSFIGAGFFVAQVVLVVDFSYNWNSDWFERSNAEKRVHPTGRWHLAPLVGLVVFAVGSLALSGFLAFTLYGAYTSSGQQTVILAALIVSLLLLILSITAWCKHGVFLVSAVVTLFMQWLVWQTLPMGGDESLAPPVWLEFGTGLFTLVVLLLYNSGSAGEKSPAAVELQPKPESVEAGDARTVVIERAPEVDAWDFGVQCLIQTTAAAYMTSIFAPNYSAASYATHVVAAFVALAIYGWILIAPMVLTNRQF